MSRNAYKSKGRGWRSSVPSGFSTMQVAGIARVRIGRILSDLRTTGNWRGVEPISHSPLVWPREAINHVLSRAPDWALMTQDERILCDLMLEHGLDLDQCWPMVMLLLAKPGPGRDPAYALDDVNVLVVIAMAVTGRLDANWPMLEEPCKTRVVSSLLYLTSLLGGFTTDAQSRSNNNDNN